MSPSRPIPSLLLLLGLAACGTTHDAAVTIPGTADAERALLTSMANVDRAMASIGGTARAAAVSAPTTLAPATPAIQAPAAAPGPGLGHAVRYTAAGSLDDVARALATAAGYGFASNATAATRAVPVKIDTQGSHILDLLRDIGTQAGGAAELRVSQSRRIVEVRHRA